MTRTKKIERIKKYRTHLYMKLVRFVPDLVQNPDNATIDDIYTYNNLILNESVRDGNNVTFRKNFSFYL